MASVCTLKHHNIIWNHVFLSVIGGKKVVPAKQEVGGGAVGGAVGGVSLRRTVEVNELRGAAGDSLEPSLCPREGPSTTEGQYKMQKSALCSTLMTLLVMWFLLLLFVGSVKALNTHISPPAGSSSSESHPKPDDSLFRSPGSDIFSLPSLSTVPPVGSKQHRATCST